MRIVAGLALGASVTWDVSNTGAVADTLAATYGISLAAVGLLTTGLFLTHLLVQLPGGRLIDRLGARRIGLVSLAIVAAGNALCLAGPYFGLALTGRTLMGLGTGAGFVAGVDLVRTGGGGAFGQGAYGGATMAGGGLAIMIVPALADPLGWRAPYWTGLALALLAFGPVLAGGPDAVTRHEGVRAAVLRDTRLLPLGAIQAATFGLAVVAGNWVVALLERLDVERGLAGAIGGLVLFAGIVTRPFGGWIVAHRPPAARPLVAASLAVGGVAVLVLALGPPAPVAAVAALAAGLAAGLPFAAVFAATQRLRPDAPATAVGLVNGCAILAIVVLTPLAGLAFSFPGEGKLAFLVIGVLWLSSLLALRRTPI